MEEKNETLKNELDSFLDVQKNQTDSETVLITPRTGLVERIDKTLVTEDGRVLLTERIF